MSDVTVLCVAPEGESGARARLAAEPGLSVVEGTSLAAARETVQDTDIDCLVTEYELPDGTGIDLIRYVRDRAEDTGCILFTDADRETVTEGVDVPLVAEYLNRGSPAAADRLAALVSVTARRRCQAAYPVPEDEADRLATLARLDLESPSLAAALDRVTELAAAHFGVDRAAVNVITESTQDVLSCEGADWSSIPREESICTYAILDEGVTVVEDTAVDARFADNETLADLDIRFYAGAPLRTEAGLSLGTLCVYDDAPRSFTDADRDYLRLLAAEAVGWFELHDRLARHEADDTVGGS